MHPLPRRFPCVFLLILALVGLVAPASANTHPAYVHDRVVDQVEASGEALVIVEMWDSALPQARAADWRQRGPALRELEQRVRASAPAFEVLRGYRTQPFLAGRADREGLHQLAECSVVSAVYPDRELRAALAESGPLVGQPTVEAMGYDGSGVAIAILDTGVDYNHPALGGPATFPSSKVVGGYDFINDDSDPMDDEGHGTVVAGIAAGMDSTYRGVAPGADIVALKVLDEFGVGLSSDTIAGIDWCITHQGDHNIGAINLSLGDGIEWSDPAVCDADPEGEAISDAVDAGMLVVVASGNDGFLSGICMPACATDATSVGATHDEAFAGTYDYGICSDTNPSVDTIACYSNRGPLLDLYAPGTLITSASLGGGYEDDVGTSLASPHVSGAAACLAQMGASSPALVKSVLVGSGVPIFDPDTGVTTPRLDLAAAAQQLLTPKVLLEVHPNERAQGPGGGPRVGTAPWQPSGLGPGSLYEWKRYQFQGSDNLWVQVCAQSYSASQNAVGQADRLKMKVDGTVPLDVWGIMSGTPSYQWDGNIDRGNRLMLEFQPPGLTAGLHTIEFWADETPILWWVKVYDFEEMQ